MGIHHGLSALYKTEFESFRAARRRCNKPNCVNYKYYGGRGIQFLFTSFEQFLAELGPKPTPKHTLGRIRNDGNYECGNVKWVTMAEQNINKRWTSLGFDPMRLVSEC